MNFQLPIPDIIFVSLENWDDVWRRNQFLCAEFARRNPERKILFVAPARDVSASVRRRELGALRGPGTWAVPGYPNVTVTRPWKLLPDKWGVGRRINEAMCRRHVRRAAWRLGMDHIAFTPSPPGGTQDRPGERGNQKSKIKNQKCPGPILWLNPHTAAHMPGRMGESAVIYDITDDWTLAADDPHERQRIEDQDRQLCTAADLVIVCSQTLQESRADFSQRILLLPNGVHVDHYRQVGRQAGGAESRWPSPVFGYTGSIHPKRIDLGIVRALAEAFPQGSVVLIGPDHLPADARASLTRHPNIHLPGPVPYHQIPRSMAAFDACIVPHIESGFTQSLNPIKLWEYLAAGLPIVSTNVSGFRSFPHLCHIASGPEPFILACRAALSENGEHRARRVAEAANHSWSSRVDELIHAFPPLGTNS